MSDRNPPDAVARRLEVPPLDDTDAAIQAIVVIEQLLAKLDRISCMSEWCDGIEDGEPATKDRPSPTRCHRCAAVRLARSVAPNS